MEFIPKKVILVAFWIHPGPGGYPPPFAKVWGHTPCPFLTIGLQMKFICDCIFVPKGSVTLTIFMYYWMDFKTIHVLLTNLWVVCMCFYAIFMPYWNFNYTVVRVGGGIDPATELTE